MFDRISQVVLVVFGGLALIVLTLGLAVSCRERPPEVGASSTTPDLITPDVTSGSTATPTSVFDLPLPATATMPAASPTPPVASPTPGAVTTEPMPVPAPPLLPPTSPDASLVPGATVRHTVTRGEWLLQITRCYGASYDAVLAANALPDPDYILPGQIITVPAIGSNGRVSGPPCVVAYFVQAGDTWEGLAARHGTTVAILQRANPGPLALARPIWVPRAP